MKRKILNQINSITVKLIQKNLILSQNFPKYIDDYDLVWIGYQNLAFSLKDRSYDEVYKACYQYKEYNFIMLDGAIIQMQYRISNNDVDSHILRFLPNPLLENFFEASEEFENLYFGSTPFSEFNDVSIIKFPLRFDFDRDPKKKVEYDHPLSHLTLGNYTDCRIPVSKPLQPNTFILFILRSFYLTKFRERFNNKDFLSDIVFPETITLNEKKLLYLDYHI